MKMHVQRDQLFAIRDTVKLYHFAIVNYTFILISKRTF